jgi:DNA gyrase/topoisomerase IV subunit B
MYLLVPSTYGMAVLNALSERLVVSMMHGGRRYRTVFSRGMIASLLRCVHCDCPLGTTWLTYRSDATIVAGKALTPDNLHGITERIGLNVNGIAERFGANMEGMQIRVEDRMTEAADWW